MDLRQFLAALIDRYLVAAATFAIVFASVVVATHVLPKRYSAEAAVMVDIRSPDPVAAVLMPSTIVPGNMSTQVEIIKSDLVARKVVGLLKLDQDPNVKEQWLNATHGRGRLDDWVADILQRALTVTPSRDSNIVVIGYTGSNPRNAEVTANAFAQAYLEASIELKVEPARQYSKWFGEQASSLRDQVEKAQRRLSDYQLKKGIVVTEESLDYELARLNDLSARLAAAQAETRDAQSKRAGASDIANSPDVLHDSVVAGLRANIAQLEGKLKLAAGNLGTMHPQYQRMEAELTELKSRAAAEAKRVVGSYTATTAAGRSKESEILAAIEAQKRRLLNMKKERDEIAVLLRDVETAKRAYEAVTNRLNQTNLESQANRTNVTVLSPAVEPIEPSFPKPLEKMLLLAVVAGLLCAAGVIFALELIDRRVRTAEDLGEMLQVPVLAVLDLGKPKKRALGLRAKRLQLR